MSITPRRGKCFHCGHDHGEGFGSPRVLEHMSRIAELERHVALLEQQNADATQRWLASEDKMLGLERQNAEMKRDKELLDAMASEYWVVGPFAMPTPGSGDADVGWRILQYHCGELKPRIVAEILKDDLRAALQAGKESSNG